MTNPYAPPLASVHDIPESHETNAPADRETRLGAALLDGIIFVAMVYVPFFFTVMFGRVAKAGAGSGAADPMVILGIVLNLVGFAAWCWLTISRMRANGQSIAKKYLGIKVVRTDGSPVSLGRLIWLRNVVNLLLGILPFYGIVDPIFIFGESRRCLHDKIADTIVVKA
jgi:uncharacterized RDD family membrane protein YckC